MYRLDARSLFCALGKRRFGAGVAPRKLAGMSLCVGSNWEQEGHWINVIVRRTAMGR